MDYMMELDEARLDADQEKNEKGLLLYRVEELEAELEQSKMREQEERRQKEEAQARAQQLHG